MVLKRKEKSKVLTEKNSMQNTVNIYTWPLTWGKFRMLTNPNNLIQKYSYRLGFKKLNLLNFNANFFYRNILKITFRFDKTKTHKINKNTKFENWNKKVKNFSFALTVSSWLSFSTSDKFSDEELSSGGDE